MQFRKSNWQSRWTVKSVKRHTYLWILFFILFILNRNKYWHFSLTNHGLSFKYTDRCHINNSIYGSESMWSTVRPTKHTRQSRAILDLNKDFQPIQLESDVSRHNQETHFAWLTCRIQIIMQTHPISPIAIAYFLPRHRRTTVSTYAVIEKSHRSLIGYEISFNYLPTNYFLEAIIAH